MRWHVWKRTPTVLVAAATLLSGLLTATAAEASQKPGAPSQRVDVYTGDLSAEQFKVIQSAAWSPGRGPGHPRRAGWPGQGRADHQRPTGPRPRPPGGQSQAQEDRRPERLRSGQPRCRRRCTGRTAGEATSARNCYRSPPPIPASPRPSTSEPASRASRSPLSGHQGRASRDGRHASGRGLPARAARP